MLSIKDLSDTLGLSSSQVRRRLSALDDLIDDHLKRGQKSKILVDSGGLELLKRLETLRKEGLTSEDAVETIKREMGEEESVDRRQPSGREELLREQIDQLQNQVSYLRKKLDEKDRRIQQLLPTAEENKGNFEKMSLFQVLKRWFLTEA